MKRTERSIYVVTTLVVNGCSSLNKLANVIISLIRHAVRDALAN